ncbi:MAG: molybdate ABC transporter substrate-binding protein [Actinomycetota bacterium]
MGPGSLTARRTALLAVAGLAGGALAGCGGSSDDTLTVFAASSLIDAFAEIGEAFEARQPDVDVVITTGGSSALRAQIVDGAPAGVFASANQATMEAVVDAGEVAATPVVFARNRLVVVAPADNPGDVADVNDVGRADLFVGLCAVGVPCGDLARSVLDEVGVTPSVDTDEPDVRSLLAKLVDGELDVGLVYGTDAASADDAVVVFDTGSDLTTPYLIAPLEAAADLDLAAAFVDFVTGPDGQAILAENGFDAP